MYKFTSFEVFRLRKRDQSPASVHGYEDHVLTEDKDYAMEKAQRAANNRNKPQVVMEVVTVVYPNHELIDVTLKEGRRRLVHISDFNSVGANHETEGGCCITLKNGEQFWVQDTFIDVGRKMVYARTGKDPFEEWPNTELTHV